MTISLLAGVLGAGITGCERAPAPPATPPVAKSPRVTAPAPGPGMSPPPTAPRPPGPTAANDDESYIPPREPPDALTAAELGLPGPDAWGTKRVHRATAVLLFASRQVEDDSEPHKPTGRVFQPLVCSIAGKRATGAACGLAMPARATIRTPRGELVVARSTRPFHDVNGEHDYPAPYGPACCMYNTCNGNTVPYSAQPGAALAADPGVILAVWPPDADIGLEVATAQVSPEAADGVPLAAGQRIDQAFSRGDWRYVAAHGRMDGAASWNFGQGWITTADPLGGHGYTLIATTDVDHDGAPELISVERWANDYGLDVFGGSGTPLYHFSCGNI